MTKARPAWMARPLNELARLIQDDFKHGKDAADRAAMPHFRDAGEKLLEAKRRMPHGEFTPWLEKNVSVTRKQANLWMRLANQKEPAGSFSSLADFTRQTMKSRTPRELPGEPLLVSDGTNQSETLGLVRGDGDRADEASAERAIELEIIAMGFKTLSRKYHPDKGGPNEEMVRLVAARDRLTQKV